MRVMLIPIDGGSYAVPLTDVREVVVTPIITPLPTGPSVVAGLLNLRGEVLPVIIATEVIAGAAAAVPDTAVVVEARGGLVALAITGTPVIGDLGELIETSDAPGRLGIYRAGDEVCVLLDLLTLLVRAGLSCELESH